MPYCYACRNSKPATHSHFTDYGALALRPPKRHITVIEAEWAYMSQEAQAAALDTGRQILAQSGEEAPRPSRRSAASSSTHDRRRSIEGTQEAQEGEEIEPMTPRDWAWLGAVGGGLALFFGGLAWIARRFPPPDFPAPGV